MIRRLDLGELHESLTALPQWNFDEARGAIRREFVFADFAQAFAFMTRIALACGGAKGTASDTEVRDFPRDPKSRGLIAARHHDDVPLALVIAGP